MVWFVLVACSKMEEEKGKLRQELLNKKELGLDNLGNSETNHMVKDVNINKFTVRKVFSLLPLTLGSCKFF